MFSCQRIITQDPRKAYSLQSLDPEMRDEMIALIDRELDGE